MRRVLSNVLADQSIGLDEIGDGLWSIVYCLLLDPPRSVDERTGRITGVEV